MLRYTSVFHKSFAGKMIRSQSRAESFMLFADGSVNDMGGNLTECFCRSQVYFTQ